MAKSAAWTRKEGQSASGGLNRRGIASYRRANPGSKLSAAVTEKNPTGRKKARRKSFLFPYVWYEKKQNQLKNSK